MALTDEEQTFYVCLTCHRLVETEYIRNQDPEWLICPYCKIHNTYDVTTLVNIDDILVAIHQLLVAQITAHTFQKMALQETAQGLYNKLREIFTHEEIVEAATAQKIQNIFMYLQYG